MEERKGDTVVQMGSEGPDHSRKEQAHLKFVASQKARHAVRQQHTAIAAGEDLSSGPPREESIALFNENFAAETQAITKSLDELVAEAKSQTAAGAGLSGARHVADASATVDGKNGVREQLDVLVDRVKGLRKLTAEATLFLPVYDLRRAQEEAGRLLAIVESTRAELAPRKKFAFRGKRASALAGHKLEKMAPVSSPTNIESRGVGRGEETQDDESVPGLCSLSGQVLEVKAEDAHKDKDFNVADLDGCTVNILHVLGALRLRRLTSCRIVCGPVRGPIYVEGCKDCVVLAAGRQLRIHDSQAMSFYVLVASGPIIEDCSGLRFAPSRLRYSQYEEHLQEADLSGVENAWADVKDFKWHRAQKSPNWDVIPDAERETDQCIASKPPGGAR